MKKHILSASKYRIWKFLIIITILISSIPAFSQKQSYNWFFGEHCGITFNPEGLKPIVLAESSISTLEGCASISDSAGNLLFYTDGITVWNRNHSEMPNGAGLSGQSSSSQSGVIVPMPENSKIYYIFTVDTLAGSNGIRYSVVNLKADNGYGDVIEKNTILLPQACEKILAVKHGNNKDIWLICHTWDSDEFFSYLITAGGISMGPVISKTGSIYGGNRNHAIGYLKASIDGKRIAAAIFKNSMVELFDFNKATGILKLSLSITDTELANAYGVEFSPNCKLLYITCTDVKSPIFQYNLAAGNNFAILASKTKITSEDLVYGALQIAPDGKIYVAKLREHSLGVINFPDIPGKGCFFVDNGIDLVDGESKYGLPNFIQSYFSIIASLSANAPCEGETLMLSCDSIPEASYSWSGPEGYTSNERTPIRPNAPFSYSGKYKCTISLNGDIREYSIHVYIVPKPIAHVVFNNEEVSSVTICQGETAQFMATPTSFEYKYEWSNGSFSPYMSTDSAGDYFVVVNGLGGCIDTAYVKVIVNPKPFISLKVVGKFTLCRGDSNFIIAQYDTSCDLQWNTGSKQSMIIVKEAGTYIATVTNTYGCKSSDSIKITSSEIKGYSINHSTDTTICSGNPVLLSAFPKDTAYKYVWSTGELSDTIIARDSGNYFVDIHNRAGCVATAYYHIKHLPVPRIEISANPSTSVCLKDSIILAPMYFEAATKYIWSTGDTAQSITVKKSGYYTLRAINKFGCESIDSIKVSVSEKLDVSICGANNFCDGAFITLEVNPSGLNYHYLWSSGDTNRAIKASSAGMYWVKVVSNSGCSGTDSTIIFKNPIPELHLSNSGEQKICEGDTLKIKVLNPDPKVVYRWDNGVPQLEYDVTMSGKYFVIATNEFGCTAYDSIIVEVNPIPKASIKASSQVLCSGDTLVLKSEFVEPGVTYSWSDGISGDARQVTSAGEYILIAESQTGCISRDSITVSVGSPINFKISDSDTLKLCPGQSITIASDTINPEFSYLWSNGAKSEEISVSQPGTYWLEISSPNICKSYAEVFIEFYKLSIALPDTVDFGEIADVAKSDKPIVIRNDGTDSLLINSISIQNLDSLLSLSLNNVPFRLAPGDSSIFVLTLSNYFRYNYSNSIIVEISGPCPINKTIFVKALNSGSCIIETPHQSAMPGEDGFFIPVYAKLDLGSQEYGPIDFEAEIHTDRSCFFPTSGYDTIRYESGKAIIVISGTILNLDTTKMLIHKINGIPLLSDTSRHEIAINSFKWKSKGPAIKKYDGSLTLRNICAGNLRRIEFLEYPEISLSPIPAGNTIQIGYKGFYDEKIKVSVYTIEGVEIYSAYINSIPRQKESIEIDLSNRASGMYFLKIQSSNGTYSYQIPKIN